MSRRRYWTREEEAMSVKPSTPDSTWGSWFQLLFWANVYDVITHQEFDDRLVILGLYQRTGGLT
jgi:hypothetical protein